MERSKKRLVAGVVAVAAVCGLLVAVSGSGSGSGRGSGSGSGSGRGRLVIPPRADHHPGRLPLSERDEHPQDLHKDLHLKDHPQDLPQDLRLPSAASSTASTSSYTKFRAPNPQSYSRPVSAEATVVFPDDDETDMVAGVRSIDDTLGRPSDMHAVILESGEDRDAFSRALHQYQERTYSDPQMDPEPELQPAEEPQLQQMVDPRVGRRTLMPTSIDADADDYR